MRIAAIVLCIFGAALAGCAGGGGLTSLIPSGRTPMRLHALAVAVCPTPSTQPSPAPSASPGGSSQCAYEERTDLPALVDSASLTPVQIPGYQPADLQSAYNLPSSTAGTGRTIAIVVAYDNPNAAADLAIYRAKFGLPACTPLSGCFKKLAKDGTTHLPPPNTMWGAELSVDVDMASAICPNCKILVLESNNDDPKNLEQAIATAAKLKATVVSNSWIAPETKAETGDERNLTNLGVPIVAAAGDDGYGTGWPAAARSVISVGGTTLVQDHGKNRGWDDNVWSGTGGGCSAYIPKPSWQTDTGCTHRMANDVAAMADPNPGVAVYDTYAPAGRGGWLVFGGTSVATPIVAAAIALSSNPAAAKDASYIASHAALLNPVSSGSNGQCGGTYVCSATGGYSGPAGFGTPNGVGAL